MTREPRVIAWVLLDTAPETSHLLRRRWLERGERGGPGPAGRQARRAVKQRGQFVTGLASMIWVGWFLGLLFSAFAFDPGGRRPFALPFFGGFT
jgi:hypothetical protein